ncbi:hypothetical protein ACFL6Q_01285 [Candidatus Neomarinimicrobiota bacterium]
MKDPWHDFIKEGVKSYATPMYIFAWQPVEQALREFDHFNLAIPIRHWLSFKTHPVGALVRKWKDCGFGVEVVSEFEYLAARYEGFQGRSIIVNGPAKHTWLQKYKDNNIIVHFDSLNEINKLKMIAHERRWHVGLRVHVKVENDPDEPQYGGQFGLMPNEIQSAIRELELVGNMIESFHFHIKSNVESEVLYKQAIYELSEICRVTHLSPKYLDCGGGLPVTGEKPVGFKVGDPEFQLDNYFNILANAKESIPSLQEIWLENGRFLTARSGVLVVRIIDIKERDDSRYLICDGGRTNNALVSDWEEHDVTWYPPRRGKKRLTTICGPSCMAYDRLIRLQLPETLSVGDIMIWHNAGAYHVPWETRFSRGYCRVIWYDDNGKMNLERKEESFFSWWGQWESVSRDTNECGAKPWGG